MIILLFSLFVSSRIFFYSLLRRCFSGVAVGAGMQGTVAVINLCCYYVIGIPLGILLAYVADLEVKVISHLSRS